MPRRPRPATRRPPQHATATAPYKGKVAPPLPAVKTASRSSRKAQVQDDDSEAEGSSSHSDSEELSEEQSDSGASGTEDEEENPYADAEPDAARAAQWVDEEELDEMSEESEGEEDEEDNHARLEADLQSLSFGVLRKAQKALAKAEPEGESEVEDTSDSSAIAEESSAPMLKSDKGNEREDHGREKKQVPKRSNKHAPTEMSSKRPVPRLRPVREQKPAPRDPRFLLVTGEYDARRFQKQYGFLSGMHEEELKTLKDNLKRARRLLMNSPRDLREEREAEVERLERAIKRAESTVNKDRQEKVQMEALSKASKEEREKQKQGKKAWFMKDTDKKELLLRAKYDALAARGGRGAVRRAIEKKQKKVSQKEKKKRPFFDGAPRPRHASAGEGGPARKRPRNGTEGGSSRKRPRAS
ncbi:hypothetical protein C8Q74DRAFT_1240714 [Fomes fomentarius]|nr:hypothetical protein C8Q74DRAFT_1240714 [Fomes fomentarius]